MTYLITSYSKTLKNDLKFSLCIPTLNSYSPPSFNIFQRHI